MNDYLRINTRVWFLYSDRFLYHTWMIRNGNEMIFEFPPQWFYDAMDEKHYE
jgi:hypothetical protein